VFGGDRFKDGGFLRKIQEMILTKMVESTIGFDKWYHQKVLLKSFPVAGHVSRIPQY
jgi:hypothetical protein